MTDKMTDVNMANIIEENDTPDGIDNIVFDSNDAERSPWNIFGKTIPRSQAVFLAQIILVYIVVIFAIIFLFNSKTCEETTLWVGVLSAGVCYLLPPPK